MKPPFVGNLKLTGVFITGAILFSALIFGYLYLTNQSDAEYPFEDNEQAVEGADSILADTSTPDSSSLLKNKYSRRTLDTKGGLSLEDRLVKELQQFYGKTISEKSTQVLLLKIKNFLTGLYPKDGDERFYVILKRAFPDLADEIMLTLEKLEQYNRWVDENTHLFSQMNELEKQGLVWKKRKEFFGDEAEDIWSEEVLAYEKRKQEMRDTIRLLDGSHDTTMDEKLFVYKSSLIQAYEDSPEAYILGNTDMLAKVFFGIDSVQEELRQLDPDQRKQEINRIRSEMGYTQEQVAEMEALDENRDRRWDNGLKYMSERDRIVQEYEGPQLDEHLNELRERYFKHEARTIELEEIDGFFRYERERIYGRN